jgi:hypothetical protein
MASTAAVIFWKKARRNHAANKAAVRQRDEVVTGPRENIRFVDDDPCGARLVKADAGFEIVGHFDWGNVVTGVWSAPQK